MKKFLFWSLENRPVVTAVLLVFVTAFLYYVYATSVPTETMTVSFLDVGQGDAVLIEAPNKNRMLIDGGPNSSIVRMLDERIPFYDRSIDVVVATHPDMDHIGGLIDVFQRYKVGGFIHSGVESENEIDDLLLKEVTNAGAEVLTVRAGDSVRLSPSVRFDVLFPSVDPEGMDPNHASVVGRLVFGQTAILLSGDAPKHIEEYLASRYQDSLESDVIKIGHHGSDTSSAIAWLGWGSPEYAVVSAGEDNGYGHPHQEVVERLENFEINLLETSKEGTITFESDGERIELIK